MRRHGHGHRLGYRRCASQGGARRGGRRHGGDPAPLPALARARHARCGLLEGPSQPRLERAPRRDHDGRARRYFRHPLRRRANARARRGPKSRWRQAHDLCGAFRLCPDRARRRSHRRDRLGELARFGAVRGGQARPWSLRRYGVDHHGSCRARGRAKSPLADIRMPSGWSEASSSTPAWCAASSCRSRRACLFKGDRCR